MMLVIEDQLADFGVAFGRHRDIARLSASLKEGALISSPQIWRRDLIPSPRLWARNLILSSSWRCLCGFQHLIDTKLIGVFARLSHFMRNLHPHKRVGI